MIYLISTNKKKYIFLEYKSLNKKSKCMEDWEWHMIINKYFVNKKNNDETCMPINTRSKFQYIYSCINII